MLRLTGAVLAAFALLPATAWALPPSQPDPGAWVPDAPVADVVHHGATTYLAGAFNWIGPWTGSGSSISLPGGIRNGSSSIVAGGYIDAAVPDALGGLYIGGSFTSVDGLPIARLAHLDSTGTVISSFNPTPDNLVTTLALGSNGLLYVGGQFGTIGGIQRNGLAAVNPLTGAVSDSFAPCPSYSSSDGSGHQPYPYALAVSSTTVYIGGDFDTISGGAANATTHVPTCTGSQAAKNLAAVNVTNGAVLSTFKPVPNGEVDALALSPDNGTLYVGGQFGTIDANSSYGRLAAVSTSTGNLVSGWNPQPNGPVVALAVSGSSGAGTGVYAGGTFTQIGANGAARAAVAELQPASTTANATSFDAGLQDPGWTSIVVRSLALDKPGSPTHVAIGGSFASAAADNLILADPTSGAPVSGFAPEPGGRVAAVAFTSASALYAGGIFNSVGAVRRTGLAALDGYGHATPAAFSGSTPDERTIAVSPDGSTVYTSGDYGSGAWSTATGVPLAWNVPCCLNAIAVAPDDSVVYIAGSFTTVGGLPRSRLAAVSPTTGAATNWRPDADGTVTALALSPDGKTVYAGGSFQHIGTSVAARTNLAAISAATGDVTSWNPSPNDIVSALAVTADGNYVFVGGQFTSIGAQPQARALLAELTASTGNPTPFAQSSGVNASPASIVPSPDQSVVYVAGSMTMAGSVAVPGFAALDGAGAVLGWQPLYQSAGTSPATIDASGDTTWTGSWTTRLGSDQRPYYAQFSTTPAAIGSPALSASPQAGSAVSCLSGGWRNAPASTTIAWKLDGGAIPGATGSSYTPTAAQAGHQLSCAETAANPGGSATAASAAQTIAAAPGGSTGGTGGSGGTPAVKPRLKVTATPARFRAAKGTRLKLTLNTAATVKLTLQRAVAGRILKHRCQTTRAALRSRGKRCTAYVAAGTVSWTLTAGARTIKLIGPRGKRLAPGRYRATFVASGKGGRSAAVTITLTVTR